MCAILAGNVAKPAMDALGLVNLGHDLVAQVQVSPITDRGDRFADEVRKLGGKISVVAPSEDVNRGYWVGIRIDPGTRRMRGGVSRMLEGGGAGY